MIFNDTWTEGLTKKQQNLIMEYVLNECKLTPEIVEECNYSSKTTAQKFLNSEKGRRAQRMYVEFQIDVKKDTVRLQAIRINLQRAFYNPADIINAEGGFVIENEKDLKKLGPLAYCIDGIESKVMGVNPVTGKKIIERKIKLCNRDKAMAFIEKAFKLFEEEEIDDLLGEKSIYEMSDEEREEKFKELVKKGGDNMLKLIESAINKRLIEK